MGSRGPLFRMWKARFFLIAALTVALQPVVRAADSFGSPEAMELLLKIRAGLMAHNPDRMLSAFDLARMNEGAVFQQNTLSFFRQAGNIRVHLNLLQTSMEGSKGIAEAAIEMEADMADDRLPSLRKQGQVHMVCEKAASGWRIVELSPRNFFTTLP